MSSILVFEAPWPEDPDNARQRAFRKDVPLETATVVSLF